MLEYPASPNPAFLYSLARELEERGLVNVRERGKHVLVTYARHVDAWKKFARHGFKPAIFRSLVFELEEGKAVALYPALTKAPNAHELGSVETGPQRPVTAYRKVDGSLVAVSLSRDGKLLIRSKGSWDSFVVRYFIRYLVDEGASRRFPRYTSSSCVPSRLLSPPRSGVSSPR